MASSTCNTYNQFTATTRAIDGCLIFLSNTLTIITLINTKQSIGQKGKLYILSLSCADLILAPTIALDLVLEHYKIYCPVVADGQPLTEDVVWKKRVGYAVMTVLHVVSLGCALLSLLSIALDRLLAVSKPIFYKNHITKNRIKCLILGIWGFIVTFIIAMVCYFGRKTSPERIMKAFDGPQVMEDLPYNVAVLPQIYFHIIANIVFYAVTIRYIRNIDARSTDQGGDFRRTKRYLVMSGVTLGAMLGLWAPYLITVSIVDRGDPSNALWLKDYFVHFTYTIMFCNSWIHPFLYCWLNKDYRNAFKEVLNMSSNKISNETSTG